MVVDGSTGRVGIDKRYVNPSLVRASECFKLCVEINTHKERELLAVLLHCVFWMLL